MMSRNSNTEPGQPWSNNSGIGSGPTPCTLHMQIMQVDAVERHAKLRKGVQRGFLGPPVEIVAPVFSEAAKISDIGAIGPCLAGRLVGKASAGKTVAEVGNVGIRNTKTERGGICHVSARPIRV